MEAGRTYLVGPGSTTAAIMAKLGLPGTLLGVDVVRMASCWLPTPMRRGCWNYWTPRGVVRASW